MPATVTLSTLVLAERVGASDLALKVVSTAGLPISTDTTSTYKVAIGGLRCYVGGELMDVVSLGTGSTVNVRRGVDGTAATPHASGETIYYGRPDQFYDQDPQGAPSEAIPVSPWINAVAGRVWFAQGDTQPNGLERRWWQQQQITYSIGSLGERLWTEDLTSST